MIEAKDTIMSPEDLVPYLSTTDLYSAMCVDYEKAFRRQAEITWDKAIREVVEWIEKHNDTDAPGKIYSPLEYFRPYIRHSDWKALKESMEGK